MDVLAANLAAEKRNNADLQHRLAHSEASSRRNSRSTRDQLRESNRKTRELEVDVSILVVLLAE